MTTSHMGQGSQPGQSNCPTQQTVASEQQPIQDGQQQTPPGQSDMQIGPPGTHMMAGHQMESSQLIQAGQPMQAGQVMQVGHSLRPGQSGQIIHADQMLNQPCMSPRMQQVRIIRVNNASSMPGQITLQQINGPQSRSQIYTVQNHQVVSGPNVLASGQQMLPTQPGMMQPRLGPQAVIRGPPGKAYGTHCEIIVFIIHT